MRAELLEGLARDELDARQLPVVARIEAAIAALDRPPRRMVVVAPPGEPIRLAFYSKNDGTEATQIAIVCDKAGRIVATVDRWTDQPEGDEAASEQPEVEVGADQDGDEVASCVVEPLEQPRASRPQRQLKLSVKNEIALDMLRKALAAAGEAAPPDHHIPSAAIVVSVDLWRSHYYAGIASDGTSAEARKKAFQRVREALQAMQPPLIGIWNGYVWLVDPSL